MLLEPLPEVAQDQWFEAAFEDGFGSNGLRQLLRMVLEGFRKTIGVRDPAAGDRDSGVGVRGSEAGLRGSLLRGFGAGLRSSGAGVPCSGLGFGVSAQGSRFRGWGSRFWPQSHEAQPE